MAGIGLIRTRLGNVTGLTSALAQINSGQKAEENRAQESESLLNNKIIAEFNRAVGEELKLGGRIDSILSNTDQSAIDSFVEVVSSFRKADGDLNAMALALAETASANLTAAIDSVKTIITNIALDLSSVDEIERIVVLDGKITLKKPPKFGLASIDNYASVSAIIVDANGNADTVTALLEADPADTTGVVFVLDDPNGELNNVEVRIQYARKADSESIVLSTIPSAQVGTISDFINNTGA